MALGGGWGAVSVGSACAFPFDITPGRLPGRDARARIRRRPRTRVRRPACAAGLRLALSHPRSRGPRNDAQVWRGGLSVRRAGPRPRTWRRSARRPAAPPSRR
ncbi:hypothetical protein [Rhodococcus sp. 4CII]|uniref:hypothetical protein n=1 Tax=Rhodococcus sp. 4CII TaxID=2834580 RepID=UPI0037CB164D